MTATRRVGTLGHVLFAAVIVSGLSAPYITAQVMPTLPQASVNTTYPAMGGTTISVPAGGDFQAALNSARFGDTIQLQAGATYTGSFTLPNKSGSGWIIVRTSAPDSSLPAQGRRITPSYASVLPKIVSDSSLPAIQADPGAHHYRFVGVEFSVVSGISINYGLVVLGAISQTSMSMVPSFMVLDRVYIHGLTSSNVSRGVALNSATSAVIDSYISEIHVVGADTQAICSWEGPGPFKIVNNYLEASGENVMFGGGDPLITNLVPSDIEFRSNYLYKQLSWKGGQWQVKNLFELKNARRLLVDGNVMENNWLAAQNGFAVLFTVRNQDLTAPWSTVEDITFTNNIVRHTGAAVNMFGYDSNGPAQQEKRILIRNNLFDDMSSSWGGSGRLFQALDGLLDVTIDHNTAFNDGDVITGEGRVSTGFTYTNNLSPNNTYGVSGTGTAGNALLTLSTYYPGAVFARNAIQGGDATLYPLDNFFPSTMAAVGFVNLAAGDYRLSASSPYKNAGTDGKDVGADFSALNAATSRAISGDPPPIVKGDFDGDGFADIFWQNSTTGQNYLWHMEQNIKIDGVNVNSNGGVWKVAGVGDFNGDGSPDILFQNQSTGQNLLWYMQDNVSTGSASINSSSDVNWKVVSVGDFNGDGKPDILFQHAVTGQLYLWHMNGAAFMNGVNVNNVGSASWKVAGTADFDGDGHLDILWRNVTTGQNYIWYMNDNALIGQANVASEPNTSWNIVAVGDYSGDGKPDILWQYGPTGQLLLWVMSNNVRTEQRNTNKIGSADWKVAGPK